MKVFSQEYKDSNYNSRVLTLVQCMRIELKSGKIFAFTNHTRSITFLEEPEVKYISQSIQPSAFASTSTLAISNLNIDLMIDEENIKRSDLEKSFFNDAKVEFFEVNWMLKPYSYEHRDRMVQGFLGDVKRSQTKFEIEFVSKAALLAQVYTQKMKATCSNDFGDKNCRIFQRYPNVTYVHESTIVECLSPSEFILSNLDFSNDYFKAGSIELTSGEGKGEKLSIKTWDNDLKKIKTQLTFISNVQTGDTVKITRGCDKIFETCIDYNNAENFDGFPRIPGQNYIITGKGANKE